MLALCQVLSASVCNLLSVCNSLMTITRVLKTSAALLCLPVLKTNLCAVFAATRSQAAGGGCPSSTNALALLPAQIKGFSCFISWVATLRV